MKKFIIGNWKMNLNVHESSLFVAKLNQEVPIEKDIEVAIAPSLLALQPLSLQIDHKQMKLCAQDCYWRDSGAFTGEISATQLRGLAQYVLVGHSERRHVFDERDRDIRFKVQAVLRNGLTPVLCIGETQMERKDGDTEHVINDQIASGLLNVGSDQIGDVIIAYEPVWAIGTGDTAQISDIEQAVKIIRAQVAHMFGKEAGKNIAILYGGSVKLTNARPILCAEGVDGLLIGGASLIAPEFSGMVKIAGEVMKEQTEKEAK
ncbi:triose-phosphate isomerase [Candidatus Saccharibacteria bacterium]|nr:triose-phosphate isomerase [Candidatus Saccharibacteria bacterium]MCL1963323.1 triose-phosphate isomerase [Candidatus Saccharibacteria bacterium]